MTDLTPILSLNDFNIQRGDFVLCEGVNLQLYAGEICHIIGANGTGKTTLLMQLANLLPIINDNTKSFPVSYLHQPTTPTQPVYLCHELGIHSELTVKQNMQFLLELYGIQSTTEQCNSALQWVDLDGYEDTICKQLSAGQQRRVNLARLQLMTTKTSKVWLLDEPFTALDVQMIAKVKARLRVFANSGGSVLMTSHQSFAEVDTVLDLSEYMV